MADNERFRGIDDKTPYSERRPERFEPSEFDPDEIDLTPLPISRTNAGHAAFKARYRHGP